MPMLRNRIIYGLLILMLAVMFVATNNRLVLFFLITFPAIGMVSFLSLVYERRTRTIQLDFSKSSDISRDPFLKFIVGRKWKIPVGRLQLAIEYENELYEKKNTVTLCMEPVNKKQAEYRVTTEKQECGKIQIKCSQGRVEDILGIWHMPIAVPEKVSYLVYPIIPEIQLSASENRRKRYEGEKYAPNQSGMDVTEVHDLREYHKGDSLNSIHWKLSSKVDKLIVREFGNPSSQQALILYDGAFYGYEAAHNLVNGVLGMTAALGRAMLYSGRAHSICFSYDNQLHMKQITNSNELMDCLTNLLESHLSHMKIQDIELQETQFLEHVILVAGHMDEEVCSKLGERTELTVVLVTEGDREYIEEHGNFKILVIPSSRLKDNIHQIEV